MAEMSLAEHNNMVKTIPSDRTDQGSRLPTQPAAGTVRSRRTRSTCKDRSSAASISRSAVAVSRFEFAVGTAVSSLDWFKMSELAVSFGAVELAPLRLFLEPRS